MAFTPSASSYRKLFQENFLTIGNHYKLSFEIKSISAGSIANFEPNSPSFNTIGVKTQIFTATFDDLYLEPTTDANLTIDNISIKEVTRDNVPRIDYSGGGCPHILAEPERTNLIPYSEDFTVGNWAKTRCTVTSNQAISPDGTLNADLMTSTDDDARLGDQVGSSGAEYTQSIYVKSAQVSDVNCQIDFAGLNTVTFTANQQWQRVETTLTDTSQSPRLRLRILNSGNSIYVWGAQLEEGSYATSYIPTDGGTVTRVKDQFSRDGISSIINSEEGVLFVEMAALSDDLAYRRISINDSSTSNRIGISYDDGSNRVRGQIVIGGVSIFLFFTSTDITQYSKIALKYKTNDFALWVDGIERDTDTSAGVLPSNTLNNLSFDNGGGGNVFYGKVKQLQVYKTANIDLAALTS